MNLSSLVGHVLELCEVIDESPHPADNLTSEFLRSRKYLGSRDRRFITDSLFGIVRHRRFIESLLEQYLTENPSASDLDRKTYRYLPLYLIYGLAIDGTNAETLTNELASRWKTFFPNLDLLSFLSWTSNHQSLEFLPDDEVVRAGVRLSFQDWMVREWIERYGSDATALMNALNKPAPIVLRVNTLKVEREECLLRLRQEGVQTTPTPISPVGLIATKRFNKNVSAAFKDGWYEVQDEGSQIVSLLASPRTGSFVIDACAGAGGKTLHLAEIMNGKGEILAIDTELKRLKELDFRAVRAGTRCIHTRLRSDLTPDEFNSKADLVLVDAPCSGSGTIRRNPMMKWRIAESHVEQYASRQLDILESNARFVKSEGSLVYATCSLFKKENEEVVRSFLQKHGEFRLMAPSLHLPGVEVKDGVIELLPHVHNTDGFFVAIMKRMFAQLLK